MPRLPYRGDKYQASRDRVAAYWKKQGWKYAARLGRFVAFGPLALAAAGAANLVTRVPDLDSRLDMGRAVKKQKTDHGGVKYDKGGYAQLTYDRVRAGKLLTKGSRLSKLVSSHTYDVVERFQHVTNLSSGAGAYSLNWDDSAATQNNLPVYLFDLTCVKNRTGDNVTISDPRPFTRLYRNKTNVAQQVGAYYTVPVAGRNYDDSGNYEYWYPERQPNILSSIATEKALIEWLDLRFVLYGARKTPSWIRLSIVQFMDEEQTPGAYADNPNVPFVESGRITDPADPAYNKWQTSWQGAVDNLTGSTITTRDLKEQKLNLRVKQTKLYKFNPTMTTESDISGHQVSVKMRYNMNKVCTYLEDPRSHAQLVTAEETNPNEWPVYDAAMYTAHPAPKGREFLMITGYCARPVSAYGTGTPTPIDADFAPSFDMLIRRKRTHLRHA